MVTLIEILLVLVVGGAPVHVPVVPGAIGYRLRPSRVVMNIDAPTFTGIINVDAGDRIIGIDCTDLPYWEGALHYPCWPATVKTPATDLSLWLSDDVDGDVMLTVEVVGYPHTIRLPEVHR